MSSLQKLLLMRPELAAPIRVPALAPVMKLPVLLVLIAHLGLLRPETRQR